MDGGFNVFFYLETWEHIIQFDYLENLGVHLFFKATVAGFRGKVDEKLTVTCFPGISYFQSG